MGALADHKIQRLSNREEQKHTYSEIQLKTAAISVADIYIWTDYLDSLDRWWTEAFVWYELHDLHDSCDYEAHPFD